MQATSVDKTRNRNKVSIQKNCPPADKSQLICNNHNTVLGISIGSPASSGNKITAIFNFFLKLGLKDIYCLLGDHLYRYTAMIKYDCNEEEGKKIGLDEANKLKKEYIDILNQFSTPPTLHYLKSEELYKHPDYNETHISLIDLYKKNHIFQQSVHAFSAYYFQRVCISKNQRSKHDKIIDLASKYLLEELAIFAILNKQGFNKLFYPGVIQTIYDVITSENPYLTDLFYNYIFVSLRISR